jgi:thioredoxin-like negative regulator of GroEL
MGVTVTAHAFRPLFAQIPQGGRYVTPDHRPQLVFFTSHRSGPARRMESLLAHIARKERGRLRVSKVDVDDRPDLAERFRVKQVPSLALVVERRVVSRLEGRATAPRIESMLEPYLPETAAA